VLSPSGETLQDKMVLGCFRSAAVRRIEREEGRLEHRQLATAVEVPEQPLLDKRVEATPSSPTLRVGDDGVPPLLTKLSSAAPVGTNTLRLNGAVAAPDAGMQATMEELQRQNEALRCVAAPRRATGVVNCSQTLCQLGVGNKPLLTHVTCGPYAMRKEKHVAF
jgi:hypothetical protein